MSNLREEIEELIQKIIAPHDEQAVKQTAEEYFKSTDSIRFIELIVGVENKFGIEFSDEDLDIKNKKDLDGFVNMIEKYLLVGQES